MSADTPTFDPDTCDYAVFGTQGGGYVRWDNSLQDYVFVESPEDFPELRVGDRMPQEWGVVPVNELARDDGMDDLLDEVLDVSEADLDPAGLSSYH